jgi:hypothetical protein
MKGRFDARIVIGIVYSLWFDEEEPRSAWREAIEPVLHFDLFGE